MAGTGEGEVGLVEEDEGGMRVCFGTEDQRERKERAKERDASFLSSRIRVKQTGLGSRGGFSRVTGKATNKAR